ncbi:hypothetical protein D3C80_1215790 [compost metagenome]
MIDVAGQDVGLVPFLNRFVDIFKQIHEIIVIEIDIEHVNLVHRITSFCGESAYCEDRYRQFRYQQNGIMDWTVDSVLSEKE